MIASWNQWLAEGEWVKGIRAQWGGHTVYISELWCLFMCMFPDWLWKTRSKFGPCAFWSLLEYWSNFCKGQILKQTDSLTFFIIRCLKINCIFLQCYWSSKVVSAYTYSSWTIADVTLQCIESHCVLTACGTSEQQRQNQLDVIVSLWRVQTGCELRLFVSVFTPVADFVHQWVETRWTCDFCRWHHPEVSITGARQREGGGGGGFVVDKK